MENNRQFEQRKQAHIELALDPAHEAVGQSGLEQVALFHEALPDIDFDAIDVSTESLGLHLNAPILISSMTAGHPQAWAINETLARACQEKGWLMGVGSQRKQLHDAMAVQEWLHIRKQAPRTNLIGNLGISQLITTSTAAITRLLEPLEAKGIFIHTNPLQECLQMEGTPQFKGCYQALERLCKELPLPVILKETGCGFSKATLERLKNTGLAAIDISGYGGTHWGRIEGARATSIKARAAQTFRHWGHSTLDSLLQATNLASAHEVWASGGVRTGLDIAKLLALGANMVGLAKPFLESALVGYEQLINTMNTLEFELKVALFCTGHINIRSLQEARPWSINRPY